MYPGVGGYSHWITKVIIQQCKVLNVPPTGLLSSSGDQHSYSTYNQLSQDIGGGLSDLHSTHLIQTTDVIDDVKVLNKYGGKKSGVFTNQKQMNPSGWQSKVVVVKESTISENICHLDYYLCKETLTKC